MATRYWVGGGSSSNWNATGNTNWGTASGVQDNASVPTSADDVIFDGAGVGGNTNSTISATITILSLNITAGYTATMTFNAVLTITNNITLGANFTIAGSSGITSTSTATITSNGKTWPNAFTLQTSAVRTLVGDFTVGGLVTLSGASDPVVNWTTNEKFILNGGISLSRGISGSAPIYLRGGTWSASGYSIASNLYLDGNVTLSGTIYKNGGLFSYLSGTITVSGTTMVLGSAMTVNLGGISLNNVSSSSINTTITLTSDLNILGSLSLSGSGYNTIWNSTTAEKVTVANGLTIGTGGASGTAPIYLTGGTWSGNNSLGNSLFLNGNITISGSVNKSGGTLTYQSGTITTTGSTLNISGSCTLNTNGINWNNVTISAASVTVTLTSNLTINGLYTWNNASVINRTTAETVTLNGGGYSAGWGNSGTADVYLTGGTLSGGNSNSSIGNNLYINGNCTLGNFAGFGGSTGRTFKYLSGIVTCTGTFTIAGAVGSTIDVAAITFNNIEIKGSGTLVANLTCSGSITTTNASGSTLNKTASEIFTVGGGMTMTQNLTGTAPIYFTGGTWSGAGTLSSPLFIQGNVTISGSVRYTTNTLTYVSGTVTTTGSTLIINGASTTLNTGIMLWNNVSLVSASGVVVTLTSNLNVNGVFTMSGPAFTTTLNRTTAEVVNVAGGLAITGANLTGTAEFYLTGGTWSASGYTIFNPLFINGNVTISGTVLKAGTLTYLGGTVTTTGSTLNITGASTLNTNGITWNNISTVSNTQTITLTSNLSMTGLFTVGIATTINTSVGATWTTSGGMTLSNTLSGTASIYLTGGTWSGSGLMNSNLFFQGNSTVSGNVSMNGSITYVSGNITTTGSNLRPEYTATFNCSAVRWNNITTIAAGVGNCTITLQGDLNIDGVFSSQNNSGNTYFNKTNNESVYFNNGITSFGNNKIIGTCNFYFNSGSFVGAGTFTNHLSATNIYINGDLTINNIYFEASTIQYLKGRINIPSNANIIFANSTILNFNKIPLPRVALGGTVTFDKFVTGTPSQICQVSSTGANYTIAFQDGFEKMARNVAISGATLARPGQLLVTSNSRFNTNRSTNVGIRYVNNLANGIPMNAPSITDTTTCPAMGLAGDPCFQTQG